MINGIDKHQTIHSMFLNINIFQCLICVLVLSLVFTLASPQSQACPIDSLQGSEVDISGDRPFVSNGKTPHLFSAVEPNNTAIDNTGRIIIADSLSHQIKISDIAGNVLHIFGTLGRGKGELMTPKGIAIDSHNIIYVADTGNHRIQRFDMTGRLLNQWGEFGHGNQQFNMPTGITVDQHYVYIADSGNNRVAVYTKNGQLVRLFGEYGAKDNQFNQPVGIATDGYGNLYIADSQNHRIKKYSRLGKNLGSWGGYGENPGQLNTPFGVNIHQGQLYISELGNHRTQIFKENGEFLNLHTSAKENEISINPYDMRVHYPASFIISKSGEFQLSCNPIELICQSKKYGSAITEVTMEDSPRWEQGPSAIAHKRAIAVSSKLFAVTHNEKHTIDIYQFDERNFWQRFKGLNFGEVAPVKRLSFGKPGSAAGLFKGPAGIAISHDETIIAVSDAYNHRIQIYKLHFENGQTSKVSFIQSLGSYGTGTGEFNSPSSITFDKHNKLHVLDTHNRRIQVFNPDFSISKITLLSHEYIGNIASMNLDSDGDYYVVDSAFKLIHKVNSEGKKLNTIGQRVTEGRKREYQKDRFHAPYDVVPASNKLFVSDQGGQSIKSFNKDMTLAEIWGSWGSQPREFYKPKSLAYDAQRQRIHVLDFGNFRNQVFNKKGEFIMEFPLY